MRMCARWLILIAFAWLVIGCTGNDAQTKDQSPPSPVIKTSKLAQESASTSVDSEEEIILEDVSRAADADVLHVRAVEAQGGAWTFQVTVAHPDTGWEDYVDGWDVVTALGEVLKVKDGDPFTRLLLHPHVGEQPFTRSQGGIIVPEGVTKLIVRAHDLVNGFGGKTVAVDLSASEGPGFEVERR